MPRRSTHPPICSVGQVTVSLTENKVNLDDKGVWSISVQGKRRFEVQGEPWMDETGSFYLADVEIVDGREDPPLDDDLLEAAETMSDSLPGLVEEWLQLVLATEKSDIGGMSKRMQVSSCFARIFSVPSLWSTA